LHQLDRLRRALAWDRDDQQVGSLGLDLSAGVTRAVDPGLDDRDRRVHLVAGRGFPVIGLGLQGHLGPAGQVKAESHPELMLPLGRAEQLAAEYAKQHGQDQHEQKHERPSRMRDGS